jgi:hypothetical protein
MTQVDRAQAGLTQVDRAIGGVAWQSSLGGSTELSRFVSSSNSWDFREPGSRGWSTLVGCTGFTLVITRSGMPICRCMANAWRRFSALDQVRCSATTRQGGCGASGGPHRSRSTSPRSCRGITRPRRGSPATGRGTWSRPTGRWSSGSRSPRLPAPSSTSPGSFAATSSRVLAQAEDLGLLDLYELYAVIERNRGSPWREAGCATRSRPTSGRSTAAPSSSELHPPSGRLRTVAPDARRNWVRSDLGTAGSVNLRSGRREGVRTPSPSVVRLRAAD